ncbi:exported hypothetical protein [Burkholderiales bacterium]|nr:exported hypothetical protein [Burkholderiales bacterium]
MTFVKSRFALPSILVTLALSACLGNSGNSTAPPTGARAYAGDGAISLTWNVESGVEYWVFYAQDPALSTLNWTTLAGAGALVNAGMPSILCNLINNPSPTPLYQEIYFTVDGRTGTSPGGSGSPLVGTSPRPASRRLRQPARWHLSATGRRRTDGALDRGHDDSDWPHRPWIRRNISLRLRRQTAIGLVRCRRSWRSRLLQPIGANSRRTAGGGPGQHSHDVDRGQCPPRVQPESGWSSVDFGHPEPGRSRLYVCCRRPKWHHLAQHGRSELATGNRRPDEQQPERGSRDRLQLHCRRRWRRGPDRHS